MSKYQAYPEYKDSGMEWLNVLPSHWKRVSLRWIVVMYAGGTPSKNIEEYWEDGSVPWLNSGAVNQRLITEVSAYITQEAFENSSAKWIPKNALVMALAGQGKTKGMVAQLGIDTTCNQSMAAIVPNELADSRYLFWWLTSNYQNIRNMSGGDHRDGLNLELLGNIECPVPNHNEKQKIASFLDHETAKIDTLIDKQQQLIQLLKEKRQAVISHAVTKGLNPNAPMRDSGVEWLGEVPEHWIVSKVKFEYKNLDGRRVPLSTEERSYRQGDYPYYGASGIIDYVDDYIFDEGLVLVSEDGANLLARSSKIAFPAYGKYWVNNHAHILRPKDENIDFWSEVIEVRDLTPYISGAAQPKFTSEALSNLVIAVPTNEDEICQIAEYIREQKEKYSNLISKANKSIKLMQERRTALISAAVTGKIDVRHHASRPSGNDTSEVSA